MPSADKAHARWRDLTPPLTGFPLRCGYCALHMLDSQLLTVFETPGFGVGARAMHTACYRKHRADRSTVTGGES